MAAPRSLPAVRRRLTRWHRTHRRDLPWRRTHDPYRVLVSEVMLQQTRVEHVVPRYVRFLRRFPTVASLAHARPAAVLREWYGLGYNRRALNLWRAARALTGHPFPQSARALEALPGIGRYSANAVATFAWNAPEPLLETNTVRVLHRVFVGPELPKPRRTTRQLYALAEAVLDRQHPRRWNESLFDLGATVCTKRRPLCPTCPLRLSCRATPRILDLVGQPRLKPREPAFRAVPRRIWRGRVLRALHRGPSSVALVTHTVGLNPKDQSYVRSLLEALAREGLSVRRRTRFALPGSRVVG